MRVCEKDGWSIVGSWKGDGCYLSIVDSWFIVGFPQCVEYRYVMCQNLSLLIAFIRQEEEKMMYRYIPSEFTTTTTTATINSIHNRIGRIC